MSKQGTGTGMRAKDELASSWRELWEMARDDRSGLLPGNLVPRDFLHFRTGAHLQDVLDWFIEKYVEMSNLDEGQALLADLEAMVAEIRRQSGTGSACGKPRS